MRVASKQETYSGPLPHPEHLAQFEQILPGITARMVAMIEKEQADANDTVTKQLALHEKVIICTAADNRRMHYVALGALALCLVTTVALAALHAYKAAEIVGGVTVVGVVGSFLRSQFKDKETKSKKDD